MKASGYAALSGSPCFAVYPGGALYVPPGSLAIFFAAEACDDKLKVAKSNRNRKPEEYGSVLIHMALDFKKDPTHPPETRNAILRTYIYSDTSMSPAIRGSTEVKNWVTALEQAPTATTEAPTEAVAASGNKVPTAAVAEDGAGKAVEELGGGTATTKDEGSGAAAGALGAGGNLFAVAGAEIVAAVCAASGAALPGEAV